MKIHFSKILFAATVILWPTCHSAFADTPTLQERLAAARAAYQQAQSKLKNAEKELSNHDKGKPPVGRDKLQADLTTVESRIPAGDLSPATAKQANLDAANAIKAKQHEIAAKTVQINTLNGEIAELDSKIAPAIKSQATASPEKRAAADKYRADNVVPLANQLKAMMPKLGSAKRGVPTPDEARSFARGPFLVTNDDLKKLDRLSELWNQTNPPKPEKLSEDLQAFIRDNKNFMGIGEQPQDVRRNGIKAKIAEFEEKARDDVNDLIEKLAKADDEHKQMLKDLYPDAVARKQVASLAKLQAERALKQTKLDAEKRQEAKLIRQLSTLETDKVLAEGNLKIWQSLHDLTKEKVRLREALKGLNVWETQRTKFANDLNAAKTELEKVRGDLNAIAMEHTKQAIDERKAFDKLVAEAGSEDMKQKLRGKLDDRLKIRKEELEKIRGDLENAGGKPDPQTQKLLNDLNSILDRIRDRRIKLRQQGMTRSQLPPETFDGPPPVEFAGPPDDTQAVDGLLGPDVASPLGPGSEDGPGQVDAPQVATDAGPAVQAPQPIDLSGGWRCDCPATWSFTKVSTDPLGVVTYSVFIRHGVEEWSASLTGEFDPETGKLILVGQDHTKERNSYLYDLTYDPASDTFSGPSINQSQGGETHEYVYR